MGYYIDLATISLEDYRDKLESAYLPPSRMMLKERLHKRFGHLKRLGVKNVQELYGLLSRKDSNIDPGQDNLLSEEYRKILLRELKSIHPKPTRIADFRGISKETLLKLDKVGIKNTVKLYDKVVTRVRREELAEATGIPGDELLELTKLADLSRIKWVGPTFASMLYDLGVDTVAAVSSSDAVDLHRRINETNRMQGVFKGQIGLNDIRILVQSAGELPAEVEY
jgi:hypothetical protein